MADTASESSAVKPSAVLPDSYTPITLQFADSDTTTESEQGFVFSLPDRETWTLSLCRRIEAGITDRKANGFDDMVRQFRDQYESKGMARDEPWEGCADLRRPQTRSIVDTMHAHLYKAIFGVQPYFKTEADASADTEAAWLQEQAIDSLFRGPVKLADTGRKALKSTLIDGTAIAMVYWRHTVGKKRSWEQITPELIALTKQAAQNGDRAAKLVLPQIADVTPGDYRTITREEVTYDNPAVDLIDILDFGCYPAALKNLADAQVQFVRQWLTADMLAHGVKSGEFDAAAVRDLTKSGSASVGRFNESAGGDPTRYQAQGLPGSDTALSEKDNPYECYKGLARVDADGDGLPEWVLFTVSLPERILLRAEIYPYFHDKPFFIPIVAYENPQFFYGYSLCGILADLQDELDEIGNQRLDNGTLRNTPTFLMKRGTRWNPNQSPFRPGDVWEVDDIDGVKPLVLGSVDQAAFAEEDGVRRDMREVSAVNETLLASPGKGDATLGATELAQQGSNTKFDLITDALASCWSQVAEQTRDLCGQYIPNTLEFSVGSAANPVFKSISRDQMQTGARFHVYGSAQLANHSLQAQLGEKLYMFAERNPFVQDDMSRLYAASALYLERSGFKDYERIIGTPEQAAQMQAQKAQAPPPPPETRRSISERRDEVLTLAIALYGEEVTEDNYLKAAQIAARAATLLPVADKFAPVPDAHPYAPGVGRPAPSGGQMGGGMPVSQITGPSLNGSAGT